MREMDVPLSSMRTRMLRAALWILGSNMASQLLRLFSSMVLTRLLVPEAFGLVATVNTLYFGLVMFSDLGVWQSIVKSERGLQPLFLGTAWSIQMLRGLLLSMAVLVIALGLYMAGHFGLFPAGTVYADPRLIPLVAVFSLCALLQGMESMNIAIAQREMNVGRLARLELYGQLIATACTLIGAFMTRSIWALVAGTIVAALARTVLSHWYLPGMFHRPQWHSGCAHEIVGFGKWIFLSSIIGFSAAHGEKLLLGGLLSTADLGIFTIASTLLMALNGVFSSLNAHLVFSTLSEAIRESFAKATQVYARVQQVADAILGASAGVLFMSAQWCVTILYDQRYAGAGWMLEWLSLSLLAVRYQVLEQLMFAKGQPSWVSASNALRAMGLVALIPLCYRVWDLQGAIGALVLCQFVSWPVALWFKYRNGLLTWRSEKIWLPALLSGLVVGWLVDHMLTIIFRPI